MTARSIKSAKPPQPLAPAPRSILASWLFPAYLLVIFIGYLLLHSAWAMNAGNEMGSSQALFTSINAATLTGFSQSYDVSQFRPLGQITIGLLMLAGSLFTLVIGAMAVSRILRLAYSDGRIVRAAVMAEMSAIVFGTLLLLFDPQRSLAQSVFLSISAFGNCGLDMGNLPPATNWQSVVVFLPLITAGGLGLIVLMDIHVLITRRHALSFHSKTVLTLASWAFIAGTALLAIVRWTGIDSWRYDLVASAVQSVNARTAGLNWFPLYRLKTGLFWALIALMSIGGASAGTAGGIKTTTIFEILRQISRAIRGQKVSKTLYFALAWLALFAVLVCLTAAMLIHWQVDLAPRETVFKAFSAVSNCGLAIQVVPKKSFFQFYILSAAMLAGRFCSLSMLWCLADSKVQADIAVA